jgi:putative transcriptional regulator
MREEVLSMKPARVENEVIKKPTAVEVEKEIIKRLEEFTDVLKSGQAISDKFTCRKVELDLKPQPYSPALVKQTRTLLNASQAVFAIFLGVSVKTVRAWEQGDNTPSDIACRFMDEIRANPQYMLERLRGIVKVKKQRPLSKGAPPNEADKTRQAANSAGKG